jgi:hypothetical protein
MQRTHTHIVLNLLVTFLTLELLEILAYLQIYLAHLKADLH